MQISNVLVVVASFLGLAASGCVGIIESSDSDDELVSIAHGGKHESALVYDIATASLIPGHATLNRGDDGHEVEFDAEGLTPGHVITLWYVPFDNPENCTTGGGVYGGLNACAVPDVFAPDTGASLMYAGGGIVDEDGELEVENFIGLGLEAVPGEILVGDGLDNIQGSEVHLVQRTHGPPIESCFDAQITTFGGCCDQFACQDLQVAIFAP